MSAFVLFIFASGFVVQVTNWRAFVLSKDLAKVAGIGRIATKMKILLILPLLILLGCETTNPLMTGMPQHWKGHRAEDLRAAWGEPTEIKRGGGVEVWEYIEAGEFVAPEEAKTSFKMRGFGGGADGLMAAKGGVSTVKQGERLSRYENIARFEVREGRVRSWYAARKVDGQIVWQDR